MRSAEAQDALKPRKRRKSGDSANIWALRRQGLTLEEVAQALGLCVSTVRWIAELQGPADQVKDRACLMCTKIFESRSPANRVCDGCKQSPEWNGQTLL